MRRTRETCSECQRPVIMCYCAVLPNLYHDWPVHVIQDKREVAHPLGTARPAVRALQRATLQVVDPKQADDGRAIDTWLQQFGANAALIYPGSGALPVSDLADRESPLTLVFIDATWRRSRRILHTWPALAELPRFQLDAVRPSRYRIRKAPSDQALSTLEAVAEVLQTLQPGPQKLPGRTPHGTQSTDAFQAQALLRVMDFIIDQQISQMPGDTYQRNYSSQD